MAIPRTNWTDATMRTMAPWCTERWTSGPYRSDASASGGGGASLAATDGLPRAGAPLVGRVAGLLKPSSVTVTGRSGARRNVDDVPAATFRTLVVRHPATSNGKGRSYKGDRSTREERKAYRSRAPRPSVGDREQRPAATETGSSEPAVRRFRRVDPYRARREWLRYEGTAQRDLFRQLRERFLLRHSVEAGWSLDVGAGPGRFLPFVGGRDSRRVALDISKEMLRFIPDAWAAGGGNGRVPDPVLGDANRPPFSPGGFEQVVVLGNTLGFAEDAALGLLDRVETLVAPGGRLLAEISPASGERSRYFARLPGRSVARLLRAPIRAVLPRVDREGFRVETARRSTPGAFRRFRARELIDRWQSRGWRVEEVVAVAPALGPDAARATAIRPDAKAWGHLLEIEEELGRREDRWVHAAAVLLSVHRPSPPAHAYD